MKKSRDAQFWGNIFLLSMTGLVVLLFTYAAHLLPQSSAETRNAELLVEVRYDGGFLADPQAALGSQGIYTDGRVVHVTRGGEVLSVRQIGDDDIEALEAFVADPVLIAEGFEKKEYFCASAFDGIDSEWRIYLAQGSMVTYSSCEYITDASNPFIQKVKNILGRE